MKKYLAALALLFAATISYAVDSLDTTTNTLKLDSVVVDGVSHNNVTIQLKSYFLDGADGISKDSASPALSCPMPPCVIIIVGGKQQCVYQNNHSRACP